MLFCFTTSSQSRAYFLKYYIIILIAISLGAYSTEIFFGRPNWVEITDVTDRFSAWSLNPNQLGLYLLPAPFFALILFYLKESSLKSSIIKIALLVIINIISIGKALFISWIVGGVCYLCLIGIPKKKLHISRVHGLLLFCILLSLPLSIESISHLYAGNAPGSVEGQGDTRLVLWNSGLAAWLDSPLIGHGPGHYSGLTGPYQGEEAHNILVDWLAAYGLLGTIFLLSFFIKSYNAAIKESSWLVLSLFVAISTQSIFHFYGRQPMFWMTWIIGLLLISDLNKKRYMN